MRYWYNTILFFSSIPTATNFEPKKKTKKSKTEIEPPEESTRNKRNLTKNEKIMPKKEQMTRMTRTMMEKIGTNKNPKNKREI